MFQKLIYGKIPFIACLMNGLVGAEQGLPCLPQNRSLFASTSKKFYLKVTNRAKYRQIQSQLEKLLRYFPERTNNLEFLRWPTYLVNNGSHS